MKTIDSLPDVLAFLLQGLYFTETKLMKEFLPCCSEISSPKVRAEINSYTNNAADKLLKLERVFNYLMRDPLLRTNNVINELMAETHKMLTITVSSHLKEIVIIGCLQSINAYKISNYQSAYIIAAELELDTATDLLHQVLEWEIETSKVLAALSIEEFNKARHSTA